MEETNCSNNENNNAQPPYNSSAYSNFASVYDTFMEKLI